MGPVSQGIIRTTPYLSKELFNTLILIRLIIPFVSYEITNIKEGESMS